MSFYIRSTNVPISQLQINTNTTNISNHSTAIAVNQQPYLINQNYNSNLFGGTSNSIDNIFTALALGGLIESIEPDRTITFNNNTMSTSLDLYLTVGGTNPQPITGIALNMSTGSSYIYPISNTGYNWDGNFSVMPAGVPPPQYNAGPTLAEFGLNQVWKCCTPEMRDTFDISTVPAGIGTSLNNGPRSAVVAASQAAGFSVQQSYNYNVGIQIIPPVTPFPPPFGLTTQTVTCTTTDGDCPESIGFPNDTAYPKQQTGNATGSYIVNFIDPVVSL